MEHIHILALSGSLRKASYNTAALEALSRLAPDYINIDVYKGIRNFPLFNPDREEEMIPIVNQLQSALAKSDGLIIASPEYAHGMSGVIKNMLDWLVSGEAFINMPVALLNTSPRATHAQAALREVIKTMSGNIVEKASISIPLLGTQFGVNDIFNDEKISALLISSVQDFYTEVVKLKH